MKRYIALVIAIVIGGFVLSANAQGPKPRAVISDSTLPQQPLFTDYRGVKLGMSPEEVRAKLGNPVLKDEELDYFAFSDDVSAQVVYDVTHHVKAISVDFAGGGGAPDYRAVVGPDVTTRADGSIYGIVRYESRGFWVSYNRTAGPVVIVTVTIQKI